MRARAICVIYMTYYFRRRCSSKIQFANMVERESNFWNSRG